MNVHFCLILKPREFEIQSSNVPITYLYWQLVHNMGSCNISFTHFDWQIVHIMHRTTCNIIHSDWQFVHIMHTCNIPCTHFRLTPCATHPYLWHSVCTRLNDWQLVNNMNTCKIACTHFDWQFVHNMNTCNIKFHVHTLIGSL